MKNNSNRVLIMMGSKSDMEVMKKASEILGLLGIKSDLMVASAHRTPKKVVNAVQAAEGKYKVIIAGAGMAAHLPGVIASYTNLPVIGVPMDTKALKGFDSLFSIVQMPPGIPVATVAIGGAKNAGLLAAQIIALNDKVVLAKLKRMRSGMAKGKKV
ncbi:MAG: 5-(carboxyamino)imidazole ribonucleotide mutase [bacterium]